MKVIDTNILARFFINDPDDSEAQKQKNRAIRILSEPVYIPITVLLEFEWVMRGFYKLPQNTIASIFDILLSYEHIDIEDENNVSQALTLFKQGFDFADAIHLTRTQMIGTLVTFDNKFYKKANQQQFSITQD